MTQYNTSNSKLPNSVLKNGTEVTLNLSSNLIGSSSDGTNSLHKSLLTNTHISEICKSFANGSSGNTNFSRNQLSKILQFYKYF